MQVTGLGGCAGVTSKRMIQPGVGASSQSTPEGEKSMGLAYPGYSGQGLM